MMLYREQRGLLLSGLALLLVLPAMLLVASYFRIIETGGETVSLEIAADKINYVGRDIERVIKYLLMAGQSVDNMTLETLAENYRVNTGLLVSIIGLDPDNNLKIDTAIISVQDPRAAVRYSTTLEFEKLSVMIYPSKLTYRPGDNIMFTVYVSTVYGVPEAGATVNLSVISPTGENVHSASGLTDAEGRWSTSFILSTTAALGEYLTFADAIKGDRTGSNSITFEVKHDIRIQIIEPDKDTYSLGENENVVARLTDETGAVIRGAYVTFEVLDGSYFFVVDGPVTMYDDGQHFDYGADDGVYGESKLLSFAGAYYVRVYAMKGTAFSTCESCHLRLRAGPFRKG